MKKNRRNLSFLLMAFAIALLFSVSCQKVVEDTISTRCDNLLDEASNAASVFGSNPTEANCEAYREAVLEYVDDCNNYTGYNQYWELQVESMDCSLYSN